MLLCLLCKCCKGARENPFTRPIRRCCRGLLFVMPHHHAAPCITGMSYACFTAPSVWRPWKRPVFRKALRAPKILSMVQDLHPWWWRLGGSGANKRKIKRSTELGAQLKRLPSPWAHGFWRLIFPELKPEAREKGGEFVGSKTSGMIWGWSFCFYYLFDPFCFSFSFWEWLFYLTNSFGKASRFQQLDEGGTIS